MKKTKKNNKQPLYKNRVSKSFNNTTLLIDQENINSCNYQDIPDFYDKLSYPESLITTSKNQNSTCIIIQELNKINMIRRQLERSGKQNNMMNQAECIRKACALECQNQYYIDKIQKLQMQLDAVKKQSNDVKQQSKRLKQELNIKLTQEESMRNMIKILTKQNQFLKKKGRIDTNYQITMIKDSNVSLLSDVFISQSEISNKIDHKRCNTNMLEQQISQLKNKITGIDKQIEKNNNNRVKNPLSLQRINRL